MANKPTLSDGLKRLHSAVDQVILAIKRAYQAGNDSITTAGGACDKHIEKVPCSPVPPLIATLHENGELIAAQATIAQQAKLIELLKAGRQGDPVAVVRECAGVGYGLDAVILATAMIAGVVKPGDELYAEQPAPVAPFSDDTVVCRRYQLEQSPGQNFYHYDLEPVYGSVPVTISDLITLAESAPVAVVMPERMKVEPFTTIDRGSKNYKAGYNAALAEVARLNGVKP